MPKSNPVFAFIAVSSLVALVGGPGVAAAQSATTAGDAIQLVGLTTVPSLPDSPPDSIRFEARVHYSLQSVPNGFGLLFAFEDTAPASSQPPQESVPVAQGTQDLTLDFDYTPSPSAQQLSLMVGLFKDDQSMLGWAATNPFDLAPWRARAAFDRAMGAKNSGDWASALDDVNQAIQLSPDTANLYYLRGDIQVHQSAYDAAIGDYSHALDLIPNNRPSLVGRAVANVWEQNWSTALDDLSPVLDPAQPTDGWTALAHRARGLAYAGLNQPDQAVAEYQAYLSLTPDAADRSQVESWIAALQ